MKSCELCKSAARMYCESDQASLCWDCDAKVHSANFLVARHSRTLLCHVCQSPTAWNASGSKLGPTVSVCESCVEGVKESRGESEGVNGGFAIDTEDDEYDGDGDEDQDDGGDGGDDDDDEDDDDEEEEELSGDDDEEEEDNQVVPWSSTPPPPASSSSSSDESSNRFCNGDKVFAVKRLRYSAADLLSDDDHGCSSSHRKNSSPTEPAARDSEATGGESLRPLKRLRSDSEAIRSGSTWRGPGGSRTAAIVESVRRFDEEDFTTGINASAAIIGICNLSKNPEAVDLVSAESP